MSEELTKVVERVLSLAKEKVPGADVSVGARMRRDANTRFARNEISSAGDVTETTLGIGVALGKRHAFVTTNQTDEGALHEAIGRAAQMAKLAPEDPERMPLLGPQEYAKVPAAFDGATASATAEDRARAVKAAIDEVDRAGLFLAGFFSHSAGEHALGNSAGLRASHASSEASFTVTVRTPDGTGSGWASAEAVSIGEIDGKALAAVAAEKASKSAQPKELPPGRYTVILEPAAVADLLSFLSGALDARRADEGRSYFAKAGGGTKLGEKLFADAVTFESDPTSPETPAAPFDFEGLPIKPLRFIDRGTLVDLDYSRYWAQKKGANPTGARTALHLWGGAAEKTEDLYAGVARGLLITRFWYTRWLDPKNMVVTGLTRDGVFLIEGGQITTPVKNFRFNESPANMLKNVDLLTKKGSRPAVAGGIWRVPALRTHEFNLASVSAAV